MHCLHVRVVAILLVSEPVICQGLALVVGLKRPAYVCSGGLLTWRVVRCLIDVVAKVKEEV
jgi:hypothetical protein